MASTYGESALNVFTASALSARAFASSSGEHHVQQSNVFTTPALSAWAAAPAPSDAHVSFPGRPSRTDSPSSSCSTPPSLASPSGAAPTNHLRLPSAPAGGIISSPYTPLSSPAAQSPIGRPGKHLLSGVIPPGGPPSPSSRIPASMSGLPPRSPAPGQSPHRAFFAGALSGSPQSAGRGSPGPGNRSATVQNSAQNSQPLKSPTSAQSGGQGTQPLKSPSGGPCTHTAPADAHNSASPSSCSFSCPHSCTPRDNVFLSGTSPQPLSAGAGSRKVSVSSDAGGVLVAQSPSDGRPMASVRARGDNVQTEIETMSDGSVQIRVRGGNSDEARNAAGDGAAMLLDQNSRLAAVRAAKNLTVTIFRDNQTKTAADDERIARIVYSKQAGAAGTTPASASGPLPSPTPASASISPGALQSPPNIAAASAPSPAKGVTLMLPRTSSAPAYLSPPVSAGSGPYSAQSSGSRSWNDGPDAEWAAGPRSADSRSQSVEKARPRSADIRTRSLDTAQWMTADAVAQKAEAAAAPVANYDSQWQRFFEAKQRAVRKLSRGDSDTESPDGLREQQHSVDQFGPSKEVVQPAHQQQQLQRLNSLQQPARPMPSSMPPSRSASPPPGAPAVGRSGSVQIGSSPSGRLTPGPRKSPGFADVVHAAAEAALQQASAKSWDPKQRAEFKAFLINKAQMHVNQQAAVVRRRASDASVSLAAFASMQGGSMPGKGQYPASPGHQNGPAGLSQRRASLSVGEPVAQRRDSISAVGNSQGDLSMLPSPYTPGPWEQSHEQPPPSPAVPTRRMSRRLSDAGVLYGSSSLAVPMQQAALRSPRGSRRLHPSDSINRNTVAGGLMSPPCTRSIRKPLEIDVASPGPLRMMSVHAPAGARMGRRASASISMANDDRAAAEQFMRKQAMLAAAQTPVSAPAHPGALARGRRGSCPAILPSALDVELGPLMRAGLKERPGGLNSMKAVAARSPSGRLTRPRQSPVDSIDSDEEFEWATSTPAPTPCSLTQSHSVSPQRSHSPFFPAPEATLESKRSLMSPEMPSKSMRSSSPAPISLQGLLEPPKVESAAVSTVADTPARSWAPQQLQPSQSMRLERPTIGPSPAASPRMMSLSAGYFEETMSPKTAPIARKRSGSDTGSCPTSSSSSPGSTTSGSVLDANTSIHSVRGEKTGSAVWSKYSAAQSDCSGADGYPPSPRLSTLEPPPLSLPVYVIHSANEDSATVTASPKKLTAVVVSSSPKKDPNMAPTLARSMSLEHVQQEKSSRPNSCAADASNPIPAPRMLVDPPTAAAHSTARPPACTLSLTKKDGPLMLSVEPPTAPSTPGRGTPVSVEALTVQSHADLNGPILREAQRIVESVAKSPGRQPVRTPEAFAKPTPTVLLSSTSVRRSSDPIGRSDSLTRERQVFVNKWLQESPNGSECEGHDYDSVEEDALEDDLPQMHVSVSRSCKPHVQSQQTTATEQAPWVAPATQLHGVPRLPLERLRTTPSMVIQMGDRQQPVRKADQDKSDLSDADGWSTGTTVEHGPPTPLVFLGNGRKEKKGLLSRALTVMKKPAQPAEAPSASEYADRILKNISGRRRSFVSGLF